MKYQNEVSKRLNRKSSTHSIDQGGSQMIDGEHSVIVSQDLRKRLTEDPSLHGLRIGRSFGVAKRSLPPMSRKCQFIRDISPKPRTDFKRLNTDESLKFQHKPIVGRPPKLRSNELQDLIKKYPLEDENSKIACEEQRK